MSSSPRSWLHFGFRVPEGTVVALALLLSFFAVADLSAQAGTITGRVVNGETLQPLPTAQVFIEGSDIGALTDANGRFELQNVPAGTHTLTAQRIGFTTASQAVTVSAAVFAGGAAVGLAKTLEETHPDSVAR